MKKTLAALALAFWPAHALDIAGTVQDKFQNPLAGVKLCLQGATQCVESDAAGKFHWTGSAALRPVDPGLMGMEARFRNGHLSLRSQASGTARLEWFDMGGRLLGPAQILELASGENRADIPASAPDAGIVFLKISGPAFSLTWKLILDDGARGSASASAAFGSAVQPIAAKVAAASASLDVTKDKYKAVVYAPAQETESNVVIVLRPLGDKVLFDGHGTDAWTDMSNGSWKVVGDVLQQTGGAGVFATKDNYGTFRMVWTGRMLEGSDHKPNILFWCKPGSTDARTLGGIQFQPPMGSMWDYTKNNDPNGRTQTRLVPRADLEALGWDALKWARCEALANVAATTIRFACCMLDANGGGPCINAREHVLFKDPTYARSGQIALMIHDGKQKQEYKNIDIEVDPIEPDRMLMIKK